MAEVKKEVPAKPVEHKPAAAHTPHKATVAEKPVEKKEAAAKETTRVFVPKTETKKPAAHTHQPEAPTTPVNPADIRIKKTGAKIKMNGVHATGRRKKSIARVRLVPGTGKITVNGRTLEVYFVSGFLQQIVNQPLVTADVKTFDVLVTVAGGGLTGQAGAIRHGIARALLKTNETLKPELKKNGLLKRDPRMKERKKYGLKKARKAPQFSKR